MQKTIFILLLSLLPMAFGFTGGPFIENHELTECGPPSNLQVTDQTSSSVTIAWTSCGCVSTGYLVRYSRQEDNYSSSTYNTGNTYYTFNNITTGHYRFYASTNCGGEASAEIWVDMEQN